MTATVPGPAIIDRLAQLGALAEADGIGLRTPVVLPDHQMARSVVRSMDGWCHGQAGHVFLRLLAAQVLGAPAKIERAVRHGETAFSGHEEFGNLCCGLAGRAYALLALRRATSDEKWARRARQLAARAPLGSECDRWPNSLYKGRIGIALINVEIEHPDLAAMPLFQDEGWL